jgi:hypothetical protein
MYISGIVILVCVGLCCLFIAVDRWCLKDQRVTSRVDKGYREVTRTYDTQIIGGVHHGVPQVTP